MKMFREILEKELRGGSGDGEKREIWVSGGMRDKRSLKY